VLRENWPGPPTPHSLSLRQGDYILVQGTIIGCKKADGADGIGLNCMKVLKELCSLEGLLTCCWYLQFVNLTSAPSREPLWWMEVLENR